MEKFDLLIENWSLIVDDIILTSFFTKTLLSYLSNSIVFFFSIEIYFMGCDPHTLGMGAYPFFLGRFCLSLIGFGKDFYFQNIICNGKYLIV